MRSPHVAVVGGGISGLAAAHRLRVLLGPAATITVLDKADRAGGVLRTIELAGVPYDVGAEAFLLARPEVPALLRELGLDRELVHTGAAAPSLLAGGRLVGLPAGTSLGVPTSRARLDALLSAASLARVVEEHRLPLQWDGRDVSIGVLLRQRFGDELTDRLVDPLLGGVYAGRVDSLGLRPTMPALASALDAGAGSLTAAADIASPPPMAEHGQVFGAIRGGYLVLVDALVAASGARLRLGMPVRGLARRPGGWRLELGSAPAPELLDVDAVLLAVPAAVLRRLLQRPVPAASGAAEGVELASSAVVSLAFSAADVATLPDSSGVLVATGEPLTAKAFTYSARKWPHLAPAATDGLVRLRASIGRSGEAQTLQVTDDELLAAVRADLATLAGITAAPVATHVQRWGGGLPQYGVGHLDRVAALQRAVADQPRLAVAGSLLAGVGVPACIATAGRAADALASQLQGDAENGIIAAPRAATQP